jgi:hypothetical protein
MWTLKGGLMNHQPFEEWLLNDKHLSPIEKRELDAHLRDCKHCTALTETGFALRSARVVAPVPGFALRFQQRLAVQKIADRRRRLWGLIVLVLTGAGLAGWVTAPYISAIAASPVEWLTTVVGYVLFLFMSVQAFSEAFLVLARIVPGFIPPYVWMMIISAVAGLGLLWTISIWRFARVPRGVSV